MSSPSTLALHACFLFPRLRAFLITLTKDVLLIRSQHRFPGHVSLLYPLDKALDREVSLCLSGNTFSPSTSFTPAGGPLRAISAYVTHLNADAAARGIRGMSQLGASIASVHGCSPPCVLPFYPSFGVSPPFFPPCPSIRIAGAISAPTSAGPTILGSQLAASSLTKT